MIITEKHIPRLQLCVKVIVTDINVRLACRIFPLTPYLDKNGHMDIIVDPRAKGVCPMAKGFYLEDFDAVFIKNIKKAFSLLMKNKQFKAFMVEYSKYLDEFKRFYK